MYNLSFILTCVYLAGWESTRFNVTLDKNRSFSAHMPNGNY